MVLLLPCLYCYIKKTMQFINVCLTQAHFSHSYLTGSVCYMCVCLTITRAGSPSTRSLTVHHRMLLCVNTSTCAVFCVYLALGVSLTGTVDLLTIYRSHDTSALNP